MFENLKTRNWLKEKMRRLVLSLHLMPGNESDLYGLNCRESEPWLPLLIIK